jgi:hypothetical protein
VLGGQEVRVGRHGKATRRQASAHGGVVEDPRRHPRVDRPAVPAARAAIEPGGVRVVGAATGVAAQQHQPGVGRGETHIFQHPRGRVELGGVVHRQQIERRRLLARGLVRARHHRVGGEVGRVGQSRDLDERERRRRRRLQVARHPGQHRRRALTSGLGTDGGLEQHGAAGAVFGALRPVEADAEEAGKPARLDGGRLRFQVPP